MEEIILLELSKQIRDQGYDATPDLPNLMIRIGDKMRIELAPIPITSDIHKSVLPMHIGTYLEDGFFPQGILDNIAGFGDTDEEKIDSFIENYLSTTFQTIINSLSCLFDKGCDIYQDNYHWHTSIGKLYLLGKWQTPRYERDFYNLLIDILPQNFTTKYRIQSLKCFVARTKGGYVAECLLNNEDWLEGAERLRQYAQVWQDNASFLSIKQLLIFRLCDAIHNEPIS